MRVRRSLPWLGWALAGVLALGAAGNALANGLGDGGGPPAPEALVPEAPGAPRLAIADARERPGPWRRFGPAGRRWPIRGEVTVRTEGGFELVGFARGEVTAVSATSLSIKSADGVVTTFALNADTRYHKFRRPAKHDDVKVGDWALAVGPKSGDTISARHVLVHRKPEQRAPGATPSPTPTP